MKQTLIFLFLIFSSQLFSQHFVQVERCQAFKQGISVNCVRAKGNVMYVATDAGLYTYTNSARGTVTLEAGADALALDQNGRMWASLQNGDVVNDDLSVRFNINGATKKYKVTSMTATNDELWMATENNGIIVWDILNRRKIAHHKMDNSKLLSNTINFVQYDKLGAIWAGTTKGVVRISGKNWKVYEKGDNITAVAYYQNDIWLLGNNELWKITSDNRWVPIKLDRRLINGKVRDLDFDNEGRLYIASNIFGRYDIIEDTLAIYGKSFGYVTDQSQSVTADANGDMWVGTSEKGLFRFKLYFKEEKVGTELTAILYSLKDLKCAGSSDGELEVKVSGGQSPFKYKWSCGHCKGEKAQYLKAGTYTLTITDADNQELVLDATVMAPQPIQIMVTKKSVSLPGKKDGEIILNIIGGTGKMEYKWRDGSTAKERKKLQEGDYTVYVTDENGCEVNKTINIPGPKILPELDAETVVAGQTFNMEQLYFDADSTMYNESSLPILREVLIFLRDNPNVIVEIGGHTNSLPSDEYCDWLSEGRAKSVAQFFYQYGVPKSQVSFKGYGKTTPIASNKTKEGRKQNQRVEIKVLEVKGG